MPTRLIHFDSIFAQNDGDPLNATFNMTDSLYYVSKIYLKSLEMPVLFNNVRSGGSLNMFSITIGGSSVYSITLPDCNYTSISTLCDDITTAMNALSLPNSAVFTLSSGTTFLTCTLVSSIQTNFVINNTQLSYYILGFKNQSAQINTGSTTKTSTINSLCAYNLSIDNYVNFTIKNVPSMFNGNANYVQCTYKIPFNATYGQVLYLEEKQAFQQFLDVGNRNQIINSLKVSITDRFGNYLTNQGNDYSFSLGFVTNESLDELKF